MCLFSLFSISHRQISEMFGLDAGDRENVITERKDRTHKKGVFRRLIVHIQDGGGDAPSFSTTGH